MGASTLRNGWVAPVLGPQPAALTLPPALPATFPTLTSHTPTIKPCPVQICYISPPFTYYSGNGWSINSNSW